MPAKWSLGRFYYIMIRDVGCLYCWGSLLYKYSLVEVILLGGGLGYVPAETANLRGLAGRPVISYPSEIERHSGAFCHGLLHHHDGRP